MSGGRPLARGPVPVDASSGPRGVPAWQYTHGLQCGNPPEEPDCTARQGLERLTGTPAALRASDCRSRAAGHVSSQRSRSPASRATSDQCSAGAPRTARPGLPRRAARSPAGAASPRQVSTRCAVEVRRARRSRGRARGRRAGSRPTRSGGAEKPPNHQQVCGMAQSANASVGFLVSSSVRTPSGADCPSRASSIRVRRNCSSRLRAASPGTTPASGSISSAMWSCCRSPRPRPRHRRGSQPVEGGKGHTPRGRRRRSGGCRASRSRRGRSEQLVDHVDVRTVRARSSCLWSSAIPARELSCASN